MNSNFNLQEAVQGLLEMISLELGVSIQEAGKVIKQAIEDAPFYLSPMKAEAGQLTSEDEFNAIKRALEYILDEAKGEGDIKLRRERLEARIGTRLQYNAPDDSVGTEFEGKNVITEIRNLN